jgi:hypothetical protein
MAPARRATLRQRLLLLAVVCALCLAGLELLFGLLPGLLPASYRERFPPHGIEFRHPGLLDRTPLDSVPIPFGAAPYAGPPPHDLVDRGVADAAAAAPDLADTPSFVLPVDADGLPNVGRIDAADLVLVGDSFLVYGAQTTPPGFVPTLARGLAATTYSVGVSGTGPPHQLSLLRQLGLARKPRLVVWLFFGGNDLLDTQTVEERRAQGVRTWADLCAGRRAPAWIVPSLFAELFRSQPREVLAATPQPGWTSLARPDRATWFHPTYLRLLVVDPALVAASPGWQRSLAILQQAHAEVTATGAKFLLVFVPSKEQVHLPYVREDAKALEALLGLPGGAAEFFAAARARRDQIERALAAACADAGIPFWSASPALEQLARDGDSGYYAADTHWRARGQLAVAERLLAHLRAAGLWNR